MLGFLPGPGQERVTALGDDVPLGVSLGSICRIAPGYLEVVVEKGSFIRG
jgi:hypothetical protein